MDVRVLMSSGDNDEWEGVADAIDDRGSLVIVDRIESDEISGKIKTLTVTHPVDLPGGLQHDEPMEKSITYEVLAQYAPGMWMKVEFNQ